MLEAIDIRKYLAEYGSSVNEDGSRILESVSCGGESGPEIPREYQHTQAEKAGLDYGGGIEIPACLSADSLSICKEPEEEGSN